MVRSRLTFVISTVAAVGVFQGCGGAVASSVGGPEDAGTDGNALTDAPSGSSGSSGAGSASGSGSSSSSSSGASGSSSSSGSSGSSSTSSSSSGSSSGAGSSSSSGGPVDAGVADVNLPPGCGVGPTTCDLCLSNSCCTQVEACKQDALCAQQLKCLVDCEKNGGSGLACSEGQCNQPSDQFTTNLFTCGYQSCPSPCTSN